MKQDLDLDMIVRNALEVEKNVIFTLYLLPCGLYEFSQVFIGFLNRFGNIHYVYVRDLDRLLQGVF